MTLPTQDTRVTYAAGATRGDGVVLHAESRHDGTAVVVLDSTPAHPVDAGWPDQGPDHGHLVVDGRELPLVDCVVAATDGKQLFLGHDIPVAKGTEGWSFVVAHVVDGAPPAEGSTVSVVIDEARRRSLSAGHTACHAASLALNQAMSALWKKEPRLDALGEPDFDALAISSSTITEYGSLDIYRMGKSLRRKGFLTQELDVGAVQSSTNETLASWVDSGARVAIERDGDLLTDRRYWVCTLPTGSARIPCGGTHAGSLSECTAITVALELNDDDGTPVLRMVTTAAV
ncbi:metal-dependent hydrolase [Arthrobacter roseus]|uniref:metal-dependent hydrolase n=1 Tax=Arthrobacter roseus TaxID=136274 RepID=UPI00196241D9|nr:metal-dependent hydrolase [Arthrobacter roseus]MBM7849231.1 alanyl-tRNA synthetase [Arthrobacter roseus]